MKRSFKNPLNYHFDRNQTDSVLKQPTCAAYQWGLKGKSTSGAPFPYVPPLNEQLWGGSCSLTRFLVAQLYLQKFNSWLQRHEIKAGMRPFLSLGKFCLSFPTSERPCLRWNNKMKCGAVAALCCLSAELAECKSSPFIKFVNGFFDS